MVETFRQTDSQSADVLRVLHLLRVIDLALRARDPVAVEIVWASTTGDRGHVLHTEHFTFPDPSLTVVVPIQISKAIENRVLFADTTDAPFLPVLHQYHPHRAGTSPLIIENLPKRIFDLQSALARAKAGRSLRGVCPVQEASPWQTIQITAPWMVNIQCVETMACIEDNKGLLLIQDNNMEDRLLTRGHRIAPTMGRKLVHRTTIKEAAGEVAKVLMVPCIIPLRHTGKTASLAQVA